MSQNFAKLTDIAASFVGPDKVFLGLRRPDPLHFLAALSRTPLKPTALTCAGKTDGGGAQVHAILSTMAFCRAFGYAYAHTPFRHMEHVAQASEIDQWEHLFNLGRDAPSVAALGCPVVAADAYMQSPRLWLRKHIVSSEHTHGFTDLYPAAYLPIRDSLRDKYAGSPIAAEPGVTTIAAHIRRGDVSLSTHAQRFTGNDVICERIQRVQRACEAAGKRYRTVIHSQGKDEDFADLTGMGCALNLNAAPLTSFNQLVHADILLTAKSSFSYVAGILSKGIVIYEPFWHSPLPDWHNAENLETFTLS